MTIYTRDTDEDFDPYYHPESDDAPEEAEAEEEDV